MSKSFSSQLPNWIVITFVVIAFLGFVDSSYLTFEHYQGGVPNCGSLTGCETVTTSEYSVVWGIPLALLGALYYLAMFFGGIAYLDQKKSWILVWVSRATVIGLLASAYFVYLQVGVIGEICLYCMGSALTSTLLFVLGMLVLSKNRPNAERFSDE